MGSEIIGGSAEGLSPGQEMARNDMLAYISRLEVRVSDLETKLADSLCAEDNDRKRIVQLNAALKRSMVALDDWLNTYASEFCHQGRVQEALDRIAEYGTIGYIANVQDQNRKALDL